VKEPRWISRIEVEALHRAMIELGGGSHGLRDAALLESALVRPKNLFAYGETDIFQLAACYAEGIARNHAFVDGNKRTAFGAAVNFLDANGQAVEKATGHEHAAMMEGLAQGKISRDEVAQHFREHSRDLAKHLPEKDWSKAAERPHDVKPFQKSVKDYDRDR